MLSTLVEFPGLGIDLTISNVAFTVFGIDIYWYAVFIVTGMLLAMWFAMKQCPRFGLDSDTLFWVVLISIFGGVVCARIMSILFDQNVEYTSIWQMLNLRHGGLAIYGGIIGGFAIGGLLALYKKMPVLPAFDLAAMGFLIGQAFGRWGNFTNQEAFGTNTTLPWGMYSQTTHNYLAYNQAALAAQGIFVDPSLPVHPTFLYESVWCALGFLLLFLYRKHRRFNGEIFLLYFIWYGFERFFVEGLRTDSLMTRFFNLRVSQVIAAVAFVVGLALWVTGRIVTRGKPLRVPVPPPHVQSVRVPGMPGQKVEISWPANTPEPATAKKREMATAAWKAQGATAAQEVVEDIAPDAVADTQDRSPAAPDAGAEDVAES